MILTTFASDETMVKSAVGAGVDRLILEDSQLSIRSFSENTDNIEALATLARSLSPTIELSVNCDVLAHHFHLPKIEKLIETMQRCSISLIRIQDPGLMTWLKEKWPDIKIHLATETGNLNLESIRYYSQFADQQTLGNEMPIADIQKALEIDTKFEIQVHGPILIQYSYRRFMSGLTGNTKPIIRLSQDNQYPGRYYKFYDNEHGHFMYLYFDRCLLKYVRDIQNIHSWLIDARGENADYLESALRAFQGIGEPVGPRPFKPGFFRVNNTDQELMLKTHHTDGIIGTVVDIVPGKCVTLELQKPLKAGDALTVETPEGKSFSYVAEELKSLGGDALESSRPYRLVKIKWKKGFAQRSVVY